MTTSKQFRMANEPSSTISAHMFGFGGRLPVVDPSALAVQRIDFMFEENAISHHTDKYEKRVNYAENTEITIPVSDDSLNFVFLNTLTTMDDAWTANVVDADRYTATIEVTSSVNSIVAEWQLQVDVKSKGSNNNYVVNKFVAKESIYILFNPWSRICRHLSQVVNDADEDGVVKGNWSGNFAGGKSPSSWLGSVLILQEYYRTRKPVKYGQCWVYAGVLATVCRCLGIPARLVTNYDSAHDTHGSLTVDRIYDENGDPIDEENSDSVWNFHVWVEVWLTRPDLSLTGIYDGWQVIDATPQEPSEGLYRVGPTSVEAIRRGEVLKAYDGKFVYAEVNADEVFWIKKDENNFKLLGSETATIGKNISTKHVGSPKREDITLNYKEAEKTYRERQVMLKALKLSKNMFSRIYLNEQFEDVKFDLVLLDDIIIGQSFTVRLKIINRSGKVYTIRSVIGIRTTLYTGITHRMVKKERSEIKIAPNSGDEIKVNVTYFEYEKYLIDQNSFVISALANVAESDYQFFATDTFRVRMPDINIEIDDDIIQGRPFRCYAYFINPLPKTLTRAYFTVEGAGLGAPIKLRIYDVRPKQEAQVSFTLTPRRAGETTIVVKFASNELQDVDGFKNIRVAPFPRDTSRV
ncbi:Annulin-like protein [Dinothrombium tinctorium]|uniref:Annulin-like protein n=1 Tax=Dinothrombium tinctorium TaxID=1965070 RepID=A0A3S3P965_9ACAR|nr:Annulin-like protein [Dinothrombium tinctorium]RWS16556.1 Annulin-like protein [Dinothrombium tinctorium]